MFKGLTNKLKQFKIKKKLLSMVSEVPPIMRYRKIRTFEEMSDFIILNSLGTKNLLDEKGFHYSKEDRPEKIALLQTEVSELIDAFKKAKGENEEAEELADIIIRLMNIPCMYDDINKYLGYQVRHLDPTKNSNMTLYVPGVSKNDPIGQTKYFFTYTMFKLISKIDDNLMDLDMLYSENANLDIGVNKVPLAKVTYGMSMLILLCEIYAEDILKKNLQELINSKMSKNYQRPYRYNTSPELFN